MDWEAGAVSFLPFMGQTRSEATNLLPQWTEGRQRALNRLLPEVQ